LGNHDFDKNGGGPLLANFVLPSNGPEGVTAERFYWFDFGDARFVCIDSNLPFSDMRDQVVPWLDRVLVKAGDSWKIVFYHHPVYTNGKYSSSGKLRQLIVPLFDKHHVHLALNGHNHMYERSRALRAGRVVAPENGTVYVNTGAGGNPLYRIAGPMPDYLAIQDDSQHSFTVVDVTPEEMSVQQIGLDGEVMDRFAIPRGVAAAMPDEEIAADDMMREDARTHGVGTSP
jgi:hypothetical protein